MNELIKKSQGFSLDSLLNKLVEDKTTKTEKSQSKQERVSYWAENATKEDLAELVVAMSTYMDKMVEKIDTQEEIDNMGEEYLVWQKITDFMESRNKTFRGLVFGKLDENFSGSESIPAHQKKGNLIAHTTKGDISFNREGGDRKKPTVDQEKLKEAIGEERFEKLVKKTKVRREVIPAHTIEEFSEDKFVEAVYSGEISFDEASEALIPGAWQTPRFVVRPVKKK